MKENEFESSFERGVLKEHLIIARSLGIENLIIVANKMDLIDWKIDNSHRKDLTKVAPNFRRQTYTEILPKDERVLNLHNGAYGNDGGSGGFREYPPYIWLMPYWAGRYVEAISAPTNK